MDKPWPYLCLLKASLSDSACHIEEVSRELAKIGHINEEEEIHNGL